MITELSVLIMKRVTFLETMRKHYYSGVFKNQRDYYTLYSLIVKCDIELDKLEMILKSEGL